LQYGGRQILLRGVLTSFKGDWKFKHEALHLDRWYNCKLICHKCLASKVEPFPFQELTFPARWWQTIGLATAWPDDPPLAAIPGFEVCV
jgi:hypothetical protein